MVDPVFDMVFRFAASLLLASAAWHKLQAPYDFRRALAGYKILPGSFERPLVVVIPVLEGVIALGLIVAPLTAVWGVYAAICLWLLYAAAIFANLLRGRTEIECGCGGLSSDQHIHKGLVMRNLVLVALLALTLDGTFSRDLVWLDGFAILFGTVMLLVLYITADTLMRNHATFQHEARS
ncbi:MAG: MauE/DoxX family redox-associated membrane protein [Parvibaculum sp.]